MNCESTTTKRILNTDSSNKANIENNILKNLRLKNWNKVTIARININFLRNKFKLLAEKLEIKLIC